ncbi:hypothetical protein RhiJN_06508 [Ceratobasidium sp. AG-Ba]|nr:hypothetical protein RhiJN_06508 [Ceratobasidium sp. AG-Ba]
MLRIAEENASDDGLDDEKIVIATCPECRCPYTQEKICSFRNEYLPNSNKVPYSSTGSSAVNNNSSTIPPESAPPATNTAEETPSPALASTLDGDSVGLASPESAGVPPADKFDASARAAIKLNFEEQAASMLGKPVRSLDLDKLIQLSFDVDDWLDIEREQGRFKEALMHEVEFAE